ncbi:MULTISPECIES: NAD(P)H-dependent flavin oxidoreductase [Neobacillus]|uniref:Probable nitronate monooxygenase n=1 Tax=Neobacillus rhizophilus TaxID=2833579 RepID=A0A942U423_9BACI|nr:MULTISPECIES: nitronate monooxygenase [Neobacillus]MBS4211189.1 nitronate monooxygenase [Neobacillus rhizophilus]MBU8918713.1 nitronate monooxygenase [Bacillus sp. FJAT-29953]
MWENSLTKLLEVRYPIIQAPMAGGVTSSELVAAVSNSGGLGMIGAGYLSPSQLRQQIHEIRELTSRNFGVNLFVPSPYNVDEDKINYAKSVLMPLQEGLGIEGNPSLPSFEADLKTFHEQVDIIIEEKVPVCSFTFGLPSAEIIAKLKQHSITLVGTATTVQEAKLNEEAGMDAVVVQGMEAGGHRGTFLGGDQQSLIGLMSLLPQATDSISIPIIAAGGIMDGRGVMAAKCLGALGVQMGTAFLVCEESGANKLHKQAILEAEEDQTVLTKAFSGKMARGVNNRFIHKHEQMENHLPAYPVQNELTKAIRKASAAKGNHEYMSLWSGQSPRLARNITVSELIGRIISEAENLQTHL